MKALKLWFKTPKTYLPAPDRSVKREIEIADVLARRSNGKFNRRISNNVNQR